MSKKFQPMKGEPIDFAKITYPTLISPKLDGIRCAVDDSIALSASCKPIQNDFIRTALSYERFNGFDGELIDGDPCAEDVFLKSMSAVNTVAGTPLVTFYVFDKHNSQGGFAARNETVGVMIAERIPCAIVLKHHPQTLVHDEAELLAKLEEWLEMGYEGLVARTPNSPYKYGRATADEGWHFKYKPMIDMEVEVVEVLEEMKNNNAASTNELGRSQRSSAKAGKSGKGTAGAIVVRIPGTGIVFKCGWGKGWTAARRKQVWDERETYPGKIGVITAIGVGAKKSTGKPRSPRWKGLRHADDLTSDDNAD